MNIVGRRIIHRNSITEIQKKMEKKGTTTSEYVPKKKWELSRVRKNEKKTKKLKPDTGVEPVTLRSPYVRVLRSTD